MSNLIFLDTKARPHTEPQTSASPRVAFVTLGCKVNQSDTQKAIADFRAAGFRIVPPSAPAEVYVVNTCSVTHVADRKSRQWLRRSARANPDALVVATGCYAESGRETLEGMDEVGLVLGYKQKDDLLGLVLERMPGHVPPATVCVEQEPERTPSWAGGEEGDPDPEFQARTRAMVKIEDGCNDFCTFCIIPFTRGMPRSTPTNEVVRLVRQRLSEGFKEIVLTGVHMGKYGQDHAQRKRSAADPTEARDLPGVVRAVLDRTGVPRLRITSVEPTDAIMMLPLLSDARYASRLAPHLHLPLQSGCDATLARMKRDYTTGEYADVVRQCRQAVPGISITTDLITGFPGETEEEWAATRAFVQEMEFSKVHVFPYSQRPGTPAMNMPGQVSPEVRHARTPEMMEISTRMEAAYAIKHLGSVRPVLWETRSEDGTWHGLTDNYLRVRTQHGTDLQNGITHALLSVYDASGLWAEVR
ncbi:MAG TPA: tRNA (N(6)-L-threonylcarbamoyladenosine(37)-C(2))-methylthiotransferase MtaB [Chloroflexia bacterium]|jgi:threonylcarbamoyladenosine tRNA methylthiotransferase MtaB